LCLKQSTVTAAGVAAKKTTGNAASESPPNRGGLLGFLMRFAAGLVLFFLLTLRGSLMGVPLDEGWMRAYAVVLGGLLLALGWWLFPKVDPTRHARKK